MNSVIRQPFKLSVFYSFFNMNWLIAFVFIAVMNAEVCTKEGLFSLSQSLASNLSPYFSQMEEVFILLLDKNQGLQDVEATASFLEIKAARNYLNDTSLGFSQLIMLPTNSSAAGAAVDNSVNRLTEAYVTKTWLLPRSVDPSLECVCWDQWNDWCSRYYAGFLFSPFNLNIIKKTLCTNVFLVKIFVWLIVWLPLEMNLAQ